MRAAVYRRFGGPLVIEEVPEPEPSPAGAVVEVMASGLCRSDYHGWRGLDPDVTLPAIPGHEFTGVVYAVGPEVERWSAGDRVTVPFACGCGRCEQCTAGNTHICDDYFQPGFTAPGSLAELVAIPAADLNLVGLPQEIGFAEGAVLGCRFMTAYRAVAHRGRLGDGEWLAVFGCGGVGLSAVMIAAARGARVVAIDTDPAALEMARALGAGQTMIAGGDVADEVRTITGGGAHVTIDAVGNPGVVDAAIRSLRKLGRHVQVGLLDEGPAALPMDAVIAHELEVLGSHGMPVGDYDDLMALATQVDLGSLIASTITLDEVTDALPAMGGAAAGPGITVITAL
jgi:D-arabinose 1-dehydrogenase-like Zn-dependent alcohol dehydrogenase